MSSTPLGMGGGVEAAATNRSSTVYLQRFSTHATGGPRARKPWVLRQLPAQVPLHVAHRWVDPRLGPAPVAGQSPGMVTTQLSVLTGDVLVRRLGLVLVATSFSQLDRLDGIGGGARPTDLPER